MLFFIKPVKVLERILIKILILLTNKGVFCRTPSSRIMLKQRKIAMSILSDIGKKPQLVWLQTSTCCRIHFQYSMKHYQCFLIYFLPHFLLSRKTYLTQMKTLSPSLATTQFQPKTVLWSPLPKLAPFSYQKPLKLFEISISIFLDLYFLHF